MFPAKYQPNPPGGSGEEDFLKGFLPYLGMAAILNFGSKPFKLFFVPQCLDATYEIWLHLAQWFQRRSRLKVWTDDGGTTEAYHTISSPRSFRLRGANKINNGNQSYTKYCIVLKRLFKALSKAFGIDVSCSLYAGKLEKRCFPIIRPLTVLPIILGAKYVKS